MLAGDGVAHSHRLPHLVFDEDETMAAIEHGAMVAAVASKVKSLRRYAVRRVKDGDELDTLAAPGEEAEEGSFLVVCIELAVELGVSENAPPALANCGGARERGRLRREA
jgi:hypothetical protein